MRRDSVRRGLNQLFRVRSAAVPTGTAGRPGSSVSPVSNLTPSSPPLLHGGRSGSAPRALLAASALLVCGLSAGGLALGALSEAAPIETASLLAAAEPSLAARAPDPVAEAGTLALAALDTDARPLSAPPLDAPAALVPAEIDPGLARSVIESARKRASLEDVAHKVASGETLAGILAGMGVGERDVYLLGKALKPLFDPRRIVVGQDIAVEIERPRMVMAAALGMGSPGLGLAGGPGDAKVRSLAIRTDIDRHIRVRRTEDGGYEAYEDVTPLAEKFARARGVIETSLYVAAKDAGVPDKVIADLMRMYAYDIDFQRGIHVGDEFEVLFSYLTDESGTIMKTGEVLYGRLDAAGRERQLFRFQPPGGRIDYFDETGASAKKFLMKTPIDGARISSTFGMRRHPVLGYSKMHKGVDFAAMTGTPIYAAGDGVIDFAARNGSFGNYVRIAHANGYKTAYAHMKGFAKGIRKGVRVSQGHVIGYVGTTGRSTGPHLHYEVMKNNEQVNPLGLKIPTGRKLEGKELHAFQETLTELRQQIAATPLLGSEPERKIAGIDGKAIPTP
ncbi:MAG: peptidoglycan DD-metalloendopeptidase family protein [Alphaproteobacteria bacterium]|nr:peptidoglycan DD-metalloendopeptidase family protein [Alphaproteobacteria bacterium]